jgi:predicted aspartyl protease
VTITPPDPPDVRDALEEAFAKQERRHRSIRRLLSIGGSAVAVIVTGVVLLAVLSGGSPVPVHARLVPEPKFTLPPETSGCSGVVPLLDGSFRVPITVSRVGSQAQMSVNVCLNGQGPFPFVIDTGAGESVVDLHLAERLNLPPVGAPRRFAGVGCTGTAQPEALTTWSVAGMPLAGQTIYAQSSPGIGGAGEPMGLLGSDVLSRFGAVRFDFTTQVMTVPGPEGPAPSTTRQIQGPRSSPPSALLDGTPTSEVALAVAEGPSYAVATTSVDFDNGHAYFVIDTGSSLTLVDRYVVADFKLAKTNLVQRGNTVCSRITVSLVKSGRWSLDSVGLSPSVIASSRSGIFGSSGIDGLLGLDALSQFRYAIVDFNTATLALGPSSN